MTCLSNDDWVVRLENQGLVRSTANSRGKRKQQDYQLTREGRTVFRRWVRQPTSDFGTGLVHDPLRTKIFFLDVLTNTQAKSFVNDALDAIRNQLNSLKRDCESNLVEENRTAYFAARNAILITKARITWLEEVLQGMDDS